MATESANKASALKYLMAGATAEQTAKALGIEPSTVSYYITSDPEFADSIQTADLERRQKHNRIDDLTSEIEYSLLEQLKIASAGLYRPMEIAKVYSLVNKGVRRGTTAPSGITNNNQQIVQLNLPQAFLRNIQLNAQSQVTRAGDTDMVTLQSGNMKSLAASHKAQDAAIIQGDNTHEPSFQKDTDALCQPLHIPTTAGRDYERIPTTTINGSSPARQAVRELNSRAINSGDSTAEALGFS